MNALIISMGGQRWGAGLDRATQLLAGQSGTVTLAHILPRSPSYGRGLPVWDEWDDLQAESVAASSLLREGARHLAAHCPGMCIATRSVVGEPQEAILRLAAETSADVLILDGRLQVPCALDQPWGRHNVPKRSVPCPAVARQRVVAAGA